MPCPRRRAPEREGESGMWSWKSVMIPLGLSVLLAGCAGSPSAPSEPEAEAAPPEEVAVIGASREEQYWLPPLFHGEQDEVNYYISRLPRRGASSPLVYRRGAARADRRARHPCPGVAARHLG